MTGAEALRAATRRLTDAAIPDAPRDARLLLAHAMRITPDRLTLHLSDGLTEQAVDAFDRAVAARLARQPVSQIIGARMFWGRMFKVTPQTLDPRPETEILVQAALAIPFRRILDLGTGTGCILLSCLADQPDATGIGTDIHAPTLAVAQENAAALGLGARAEFLLSDWLGAVTGQFDLIVSNPPYIAEAEMAALSPDVRDWEPHRALTPGGDGLAPYRQIAGTAGAHLVPGGRLLLEIGPTQGQAVADLLRAHGFADIRVLPDFDGRDRVVAAQNPATLPA